MHCQELRSGWSGIKYPRVLIPVRPILWSVLFHGLLLLFLHINWHPISLFSWANDKLLVRLMSVGDGENSLESSRVSGIDDGSNGIGNIEQRSVAPGVGIVKPERANNETAGLDDGYLPQELLSRAAIPEDDIDLQDITPPGEGAFQMYLWVDSRGDVTRIDVQESEVAEWFVEKVVDRFKKSKFKPGLRDNKPVAAIMHIEVFF